MTRSILLGCMMAAVVWVTTPVSVANARRDVPAVDVALVLAADISGSMTAEEVHLQRMAYVTALRDPRVIRGLADSAERFAGVEHKRGNYEEAIGQMERAIALAEQLGDEARRLHAVQRIGELRVRMVRAAEGCLRCRMAWSMR